MRLNDYCDFSAGNVYTCVYGCARVVKRIDCGGSGRLDGVLCGLV